MANIVGLDLNIDQDYLAESVKQSVIMGIAEALNGKNEVVSQIVKMVLTQKVNENGTISSYRNDNRYTLLEVYVKKMLTEEVKEEIKEMAEQQRSKIREAIKMELSRADTIDKYAEVFVSNIAEALNDSWSTKIDIELQLNKGE